MEKPYKPVRLSIKQFAESDRPREKFALIGKGAVSNVELLAILIRSGSKEKSALELAQEVLYHYDNHLGRLARASSDDLMAFKGVGAAKAISILAALELARRLSNVTPDQRHKITSSLDAYNNLKEVLTAINHEEFWVLFMDRSNKVIWRERISQGGISGTVVDARLVFKKALDKHTVSLILAHNHPSGNKQPSEADIQLTRKLKKGAASLDMNLLDHLIITDTGFYSFADEGLI